jgi:hypothetical protein
MVWRQRYGSKYGAKSTIYNGVQYHSKKEAAVAARLDLEQKAGAIKGWDRQFPVELRVNNFPICKYYVDFRVFHNDETIELLEVKGFETEVFRLKRKLLEAAWLHENPKYRYTVEK